jgi:cysteinyl-tRNA synthetase
VLFQINITDVDDKIILRARRNKLLDDFRAGLKPGEGSYAEVAATIQATLKAKVRSFPSRVARRRNYSITLPIQLPYDSH